VTPPDTIQAISLWQPYAGLVAAGLKTIETRPRRTHHRGPLVICSTQKVDEESWMRLLPLIPEHVREVCALRGQALAVVDVQDCRPLMPEDEPASWFYAPGRYAWPLANIRRVRPFAVRGAQGFFYIPRVTVEAGLVEACAWTSL
jgi:hypothetical protein